jgi:hypothetical protein
MASGGTDRCGFYLGNDEHRRSIGTRTTIGKRRMVAALVPAESFQKRRLLEAIQRPAARW